MEGFLIFVFIAIAVAVAIGLQQKGNAADSYQRLAQRHVGRFEAGGWFGRPKAEFEHGGAHVVVDVYSTGGKHPTYYTQVHFFLGRQPSVRCEVYPEGMWSRVGKLLGMQDIEIGSPGFDARYTIKGDDGAALRNLLSRGVQDQIERLRRFLGNGDIYVSFDRREILVKKKSYLRDFDRLEQFTGLALGLYDEVTRTAREGIEFVKMSAPPKLTEAICQICGETIEADVVLCRRCKTPHHRECWEYYGACSTYGCMEQQYRRPESKRARRAQKQLHP